MIILSLDSGIERTGFALIKFDDKIPSILKSGTIKTLKTKTTENRILDLYNYLYKLIIVYCPKKIIIERLFFSKNQKTAITVSQSQGAILLLAAQQKIFVDYLTPLQIKQIITGYGQSDKKSVQKMLKLTLNIIIPADQDDEADAIACGLAYCYLNKNLVE